MAKVLIKQLYDDFCNFYPITSVDAVVGGNLTEALVPESRDLSEYILPKFAGDGTPETAPIFQMLTYDSHIVRYIVELTLAPNEAISPGNNLISNMLPLTLLPNMTICMKTLVDDTKCKCIVYLDANTGKLNMSCIPYEFPAEDKTDPSNPRVDRVLDINITQISASGMNIIK